MCGIIGITYGAGAGADSGDGEVLDVLLEGLSRLEYRGYDSAGLALVGAAGEQGIWRARAANGTRSLDDLVKRAEAAPEARAPVSATPGGPRTAGRPRATPIPMSTARGGWPSSTTGSSRTTSS